MPNAALSRVTEQERSSGRRLKKPGSATRSRTVRPGAVQATNSAHSARGAAPSRRNRIYAGPEKIRAAFLAGQGKNAAEIADELGGATPRKIRDMLRDAGIPMVRPFGRPKAVRIDCTNSDIRLLHEAAAEREAAPGDFALHLLRVVLSEPVLLKNLLDESDE